MEHLSYSLIKRRQVTFREGLSGSPGKASLVAQKVKNPPAMWETWVRSLDWEDPPGEGNTYPLQYSGLKNSADRGTWQAIVHRVAKSWT